MRKIENEYLCVMVDDQGAQLSSLYDKKTGRELLWSADPAVWGYHAPVLFPFVGMVNNGQYRYKGETYQIRQHGFARQSLFECTAHTDLSVTHRLTAGDETRKLFPMDFCLEVTHTLEEGSLRVGWKVTNPSPEDPLFFSIGAHPGFTVPLCEQDRKEDCFVLFHGCDELKYILVDLAVTAADPDHVYTMALDNGFLKLERHLFDIDTFIFENAQIEKVSLCGSDRKPYVTVSCPGFPRFGLWTKSDEAPFVCLEPWYGRLDDRGFTGELPEKTGILHLEPGRTFDASYTISVP